MPLYDFRCKLCRKVHRDVKLRMGEKLTRCPTCGEEALEQILHPPAIKFVGSGFYVNDYKGK